MFKRTIPMVFAIALGLAPLGAQEKPTVVVNVFTVAAGVKWPYDATQMQGEAIAEVMAKDGAQFNVVAQAPAGQTGAYTLDGEVLDWHKGNAAERMLLAGGSIAGRENAKIHYWLTDKNGKKVFEHTDTIRQTFMDNPSEKNSGTLGRPFGGKIAERLKEAKLATNL